MSGSMSLILSNIFKVVMVLTLWVGLSSQTIANPTNRLVYVLYRDGVQYFVYVFCKSESILFSFYGNKLYPPNAAVALVNLILFMVAPVRPNCE